MAHHIRARPNVGLFTLKTATSSLLETSANKPATTVSQPKNGKVHLNKQL
jgi:hypothetical protein